LSPNELKAANIRSAKKIQRVIIARDYSANRMNNTKWMELIQALEDLPLRFRIKFVDDDKVTEWEWLRSFRSGYFETGSCGPFKPFLMEWLEVDPFKMFGEFGRVEDCDKRVEIGNRLNSFDIPFDIVNDLFRITGYV